MSTRVCREQLEDDAHLIFTFNKITENGKGKITGKAILKHSVPCKFEKIVLVPFVIPGLLGFFWFFP